VNPAAPVTVVARWSVTTGAVETVLSLVCALQRATLAEPGCLGYDVFRSVDTPNELLLLERYVDTAAIDAHRAAAHYADLVVQRILPLLAERKVEFLVARDRGRR